MERELCKRPESLSVRWLTVFSFDATLRYSETHDQSARKLWCRHTGDCKANV